MERDKVFIAKCLRRRKTGTTNEYKDYWISGLNDRYTAAVWIGYDKPQSMQNLENDKIHHRIFNAVIQ